MSCPLGHCELVLKLGNLLQIHGFEAVLKEMETFHIMNNEEIVMIKDVPENQRHSLLFEAVIPKLISFKRLHDHLERFSRAVNTIDRMSIEGVACSKLEPNDIEDFVRVAIAIGYKSLTGEIVGNTLCSFVSKIGLALTEDQTAKQALKRLGEVSSQMINSTSSLITESVDQRVSKVSILQDNLESLLRTMDLTERQYLMRIFSAFEWTEINDVRKVSTIDRQIIEEIVSKIVPHIVDTALLDDMGKHLFSNEFRRVREFYRNKIIRYWTFLRNNLEFGYLLDKLCSLGFLTDKECEDIRYLQVERFKKFNMLMYKVIKKIQNEKMYNSFLKSLEGGNEFILEQLQQEKALRDWRNEVEDETKTKYILMTNYEALLPELPTEYLVDVMLENIIILLDDHETICKKYGGPKMPKLLLDVIIKYVEKGSYPCMLYALRESDMENDLLIYIEDLLRRTPPQTCEESSETSVHLERCIKNCWDKSETVSDITMTIQIQSSEKEKIENAVFGRFNAIRQWILPTFVSVVTEIYRGSIILSLRSYAGNLMDQIGDSIRNKSFFGFFTRLFNDNEIKKSLPPGEFVVKVTGVKRNLGCLSEGGCIEEETNDTILTKNREFLLNELEPLSLLKGFVKRGKSEFEQLNILEIPDRKKRVKKILEVLEASFDTLKDDFLDILKEEMVYVFECLNVQRELALLDKNMVRTTVVKNIEAIVDEVELPSLRVLVCDRGILPSTYFREISTKRYTSNQDKMLAIMFDIIEQGSTGVCAVLEAVKRANNDRFWFYMRHIRSHVPNTDDEATENGQVNREDDGLLFDIDLSFNVQTHENIDACSLKTILLLDVGESLDERGGYQRLKTVVADYLASQSIQCEISDVKENIATVLFNDKAVLHHHFRSNLDIVKLLTKSLPKPSGISSITDGLELCKMLVGDAGKKVNSDMPDLFMRVILVSDGVFIPDTFIKICDGQSEVNKHVLELCKFLKENNVEISCVPVGKFNNSEIEDLCEMIGSYPKEPLHFLSKMTKGKIVYPKDVQMLGSERQDRITEYVQKLLDELIEDDDLHPMIRIVKQAAKENITNVYKVKGMLRDEGIEDVCDTQLASLLRFFRTQHADDTDDV